VESKIEQRVLHLTLDRQEKRNALSQEVCEFLLSNLESADANPNVGAILLEARGPVFCAGMDLEESLRPDASERTKVHAALFSAGLRIKKPLIAAVNGSAMGGGVGLVAMSHVVLAAETATFALTEIRLGLWPFVIWKPVALALGERRMVELALTARQFTAHEAESWGLVHRVVEPGRAAEEALGLARQIAGASADLINRAFALVHGARGKGVDESIELALRLRAEILAGPDFHEGVQAWREKRAPNWPSLSRDS
jgi:enoyl-CoA hydratase/carnithine racemase